MKYRITEFGKMIGLDPSTIRYYEKKGVYRQVRNEKGYRLFNKQDAFLLNNFQAINCRGYSIKESTKLLQGQTIKEAIESLNDNVCEMQKELLFLTEKKKYTEETIDLLQRLQKDPKKVYRCTLGDYCMLPASFDGDFTITQKNSKVREKWQEFMPFTRYIGYGKTIELLKENPREPDYGQVVKLDDFIRFDYPGDETVETIHLGECICFFCVYDENERIKLEDYPFVKQYLRENQLELQDRFLIFFLMMHLQGVGDDVGMMVIPVKKENDISLTK